MQSDQQARRFLMKQFLVVVTISLLLGACQHLRPIDESILANGFDGLACDLGDKLCVSVDGRSPLRIGAAVRDGSPIYRCEWSEDSGRLHNCIEATGIPGLAYECGKLTCTCDGSAIDCFLMRLATDGPCNGNSCCQQADCN